MAFAEHTRWFVETPRGPERIHTKRFLFLPFLCIAWEDPDAWGNRSARFGFTEAQAARRLKAFREGT